MGALADTPHPALRIQHALDELRSGNSLEYLRLQHALRGTNGTTLTNILEGLTHFAIKLHDDDDTAQRPLHTLFTTALQIDLPTVAGNIMTIEAIGNFLRNLVSADVRFVEAVVGFVRRGLLMPVEGREKFMRVIEEIVEFLLCTHARCSGLIVKILRDGYPHAVRPVEEHIPYMRGILSLTRKHATISKALTSVVYERIVAVEALSHELDGDDMMKMEKLLAEVFLHLDNAKGKTFYRVFEDVFQAYESFVVPCETRFCGYTILYGAEIGGLVYDTVERLSVGFFERRLSRLREKFLEHSCGILIRSKSIGKEMVLLWMRNMSNWLNSYIDNTIRRGDDDEIDVDIHHLFYSGTAALIMVICQRCDVVDEMILGDMRIGRIVACGMAPMLMLNEELCRKFLSVAGDAVLFSETRYRPSRTRYGGRNTFEFGVCLPELSLLPSTRQLVDGVVRWDGD